MSGTPPASLTPPALDSRSSSPAGDRPRAVSGSLKDRIAKFNNPSAQPLVPKQPFGTAGPPPSSSTNPRGGLIGNRIPSFDARSAAISTSQRKVSEPRGLIGNRIPNVSTTKAPGRSASPAGSVASSDRSAAPASSGSPNTSSRSSSPSTSPGPGLPPSLLASTMPDDIPTGAMTPSSTRAEAGESVQELSAPGTPVANAAFQLPPPEYDLVPGNLKYAAANMIRGLSAASGPRSFAASVASSLMSQYDPSSTGSETAQKMMQDVSGISTPTGTPKAAHKELDLENISIRGEGSVREDGSEMDEDGPDAVAQQFEGLGVQVQDLQDRNATPEPPRIDVVPARDTSFDADPAAPDSEQHETVATSSEEGLAGPPLAHHPNADSDPADLEDGNLYAHVEDQVAEQRPLDNGTQMGGVETQAGRGASAEPGFLQKPDAVGELSPGSKDASELQVRDATPKPTEEQVLEEGNAPLHNGMSLDERKAVEDWQNSQGSTYDASDSGQQGDEATQDDHDSLTESHSVDEAPSAEGLETSSAADPILPTPPSEDPNDTPLAQKPLQLHLEPAPVAQPAEEGPAAEESPSSANGMDVPSATRGEDEAETGQTTPPAFPTAPDNELDDVNDEPSTAGAEPPVSTGAHSTSDTAPLDAAVMKSFPEVPDESKPRVEVHVQSPQSTPQKRQPRASFDAQQTPLVTLPGQSKSLTTKSPPGDLDVDTTPQQNPGVGVNKRHSTRKSPKSPLLDDEDPGDFEQGEGWAVVTKGRDQ